jgi:DNA-binding MarR family transcriptional regulator
MRDLVRPVKRENNVSTQRRLSKADYQRLAEFRHHLRNFIVFSEKAASEHGLTAQQHQALLAIKGAPGPDVSMGDLAERLGVKHHSAVGLVDRLAAHELVERRPGLLDKRQVLLELTEKAEDILAELSHVHRQQLRRIAPLLKQLIAEFER